MNPYRIAKPYDSMSRRLIPYADVAQFVDGQIKRHHPGVQRVLEIASGTGNLMLELANHGYEMVGLDYSPEMLDLAREKADDAGIKVTFVCQDMRRPYTGRHVDAVVCFYGGLNFLTSTADLLAAFDAAYTALKPGGVLLFDQFAEAKMRASFSGIQAGDFGEFYVITQSRCDAAGAIDHRVTYFLRENGHYCREEEQHHIRIHPVAEVKAALADAGFNLLTKQPMYPAIEAPTLKDVHLFIARKPASGDIA